VTPTHAMTPNIANTMITVINAMPYVGSLELRLLELLLRLLLSAIAASALFIPKE
jgi:hypothetical protein